MTHQLLGRLLALSIGLQLMPLWAQSATDDRIRELERRISDLEEKLKASDGAKESKEKPLDPKFAVQANQLKENPTLARSPSAASVTADVEGFKIKSADGNFMLKIGADLQVDNRTFTGDGSSLATDNTLLRRVRPTFSGTVYKYVDFFFRPDFGGGQTLIYDAYVELKYLPGAYVRAGKFKPPVGLERLQSDDDTNFVERGLPTLLVPSRDIGYQISGNILKRRVNYAVGVFNGVPDNGLSDAAVSSHKEYAARLFLTPFQPNENALSGLGFGMGTSGGGQENVALPAYKTFGQNTFMTFNSGVTSAGHRTRLAPQAYYYLGPFGLLAEYTLSEEGFRKNAVQRNVAFRAWQVQATYILTGERKGFTAPSPAHPFDPLHHGWGAVELAARVGDFSAEQGVYNYGFIDPAKSPRRAHEWVGGVNWYLNRLVRLSLDYGSTNFAGGAPKGTNRPAENVILARFQLNFI